MATTGPRRHHVGVDLAGVGDDLVGRPPLADRRRHVHAALVGPAPRLDDRLAADLLEGVPEAVAHRLGRPVELLGVEDVQRLHPGVEPRGDVRRHVYRTLDADRPVRSEQHRLERGVAHVRRSARLRRVTGGSYHERYP